MRLIKVNTKFSSNQGRRWYHYANHNVKMWATGFAYYQDNLFKGRYLIQKIRKIALTKNKIYQFISELNGNYALVYVTKEFVVAVVDHIRSIPIFYSFDYGQFFFSDDAAWIRGQLKEPKIDRNAALEFALTGYVTGRDTVITQIKQLKPGEIALINVSSHKKLSISAYNKNISRKVDKYCEENISHDFHRVINKVFTRLIGSLKGKKIVVPLSAGYDSFFIVCMLKKLDAKDVLCFSYGRKGNYQAEVSKKRANSIGYDWAFIPYDRKRWRAWQKKPEWHEFCKYASNLHVLPHIQDWPAVFEMKRREMIQNESVFVPGHTVAIKLSMRPESKSRDELVRSILNKHYTLWDWSLKKRSIEKMVRYKILTSFEKLRFTDYEDTVRAYESWEWNERQIKFIINAVRVYEFFGYEWRLPLWDKDFVQFWKGVPLQLRIDKLLLRKVTAQFNQHDTSQNLAALNPSENEKKLRSNLSIIRENIKSCPTLFYFLNKLDLRRTGILDYWLNPYCYTGNMSFLEFLKYYHYTINANSILMKSVFMDSDLFELPNSITSFFNKFKIQAS